MDRVNLSFPYLYFSTRCGMLIITFGALLAWGITGFNIVEGAVPVIGIQWSTFATFGFFFYLMMVNFQVGGLRELGQLKREIRYDFRYIGMTIRSPKDARQHYLNTGVLDPLRALIISGLVCIGALFVFEAIWVPLYDFFQFGSLMWPVYFAVTSFPPVILRNMLLFVGPLLLLPLLFGITLDGPKKERFKVKWRFDFGFGWVLLLAISFWLAWIAFPHESVNVTALSVGQVIGPTSGSFSLANCYIWPTQHFFPQNTYTFYPCNLLDSTYTPPQILGFFDPNPWTHIINVLTKFFTFAAVIYPAMAFVKRAT